MKINIPSKNGINLDELTDKHFIVGKDSNTDVFIVTRDKKQYCFALCLNSGVTTGNCWESHNTIQEVLTNIYGLVEAHAFETAREAYQWVTDNCTD